MLGQSCAVSNGEQAAPLVLDGSRLYLRRFWRYEQAIAAGIRTRLDNRVALTDTAPLKTALDTLFGTENDSDGPPDYQKVACALAARNRFSVITGGPGTGKTTTVVNLLAALQSMACESAETAGANPYLRIRLSAPTGKAAARLSESIGVPLTVCRWKACRVHRINPPFQPRSLHYTGCWAVARVHGVFVTTRTIRCHWISW